MSFDASIPRAELHLHAGGSFPTKYLCKIATTEDAATLKAWQEKVAGRVSYNEAFSIFGVISRIINSNERVEEGTYKLCKAQKRDGVTKLELRSGLKSLDGDEEAYLNALLRGIKRANISATVILSIKRDSTPEYVEKTCELALRYRNRGVVGIDISGDSTKGDIRPLLAMLKKARDAGLFLTVHMGESPDEKDQMVILRELNPHRIDHGVSLVAEAVDWIKERRIPVTVCPASSRLCSMHGEDESHRWVIEHKNSGHPIIIGTDDPTVFCKSLTDEYLALEPILGLDALHTLAKESFKYAFRPLPEGFLPFAEFRKKFMLAETSTEKSHPLTKNLSEVIQRNPEEGMELLLKLDELVLGGFESFIEIIDKHAQDISDTIKAGGNIYLLGSGSSGRVSVDIAARLRAAFGDARIEGLVSGGDSAMIRPKEGFEDSYANGKLALQNKMLKETDVVFVISASGSATFNEGCADYARDCNAKVYYFYNSEIVPERTQKLFERGVKGLCVDIGPQAVAGSTRLQAATLAQCCLGSLLASAYYKSIGNDKEANRYPTMLLNNMRTTLSLLRSHIGALCQIAKAEHAIFAHPESNFRRLKDDPKAGGYVTMLAMKDSMRETLIDSTESSPTFSTNPIRRETEAEKKRAEFRAYMVGEKDNRTSWSDLLGRKVNDPEDVDTFMLSAHADAIHSYKNRPKGCDNFVFAVAKVVDQVPLELLEALDEASGTKGLLLLCNGVIEAATLRDRYNEVVVLENVPTDALGLSESILLKTALNLISNTSMGLMQKMYGNLMIDVRASNEKLKGRCVRLVEEIIKARKSQEEIYHALAHVYVAMQKATQEGIYVPSIVKILAQMYAKNLTPDDFDQVVAMLRANQEQLSL